jgi:hypothetical protein
MTLRKPVPSLKTEAVATHAEHDGPESIQASQPQVASLEPLQDSKAELMGLQAQKHGSDISRGERAGMKLGVREYSEPTIVARETARSLEIFEMYFIVPGKFGKAQCIFQTLAGLFIIRITPIPKNIILESSS